MNSDSNESSEVKLLKLQTQGADFISLDKSGKDRDLGNEFGLLQSRKWVFIVAMKVQYVAIKVTKYTYVDWDT